MPATHDHAEITSEQTRTFRRLMWPRLCAFCFGWIVVAVALPLSSAALSVGLIVIAGVAVWTLTMS